MKNENLNQEIWEGKTLSNLIYDIYNKCLELDEELNEDINGIKSQMNQEDENIQRTIMLSPLVTEKNKVKSSNRETLVKIANIAQKIIVSENKEVDVGFSIDQLSDIASQVMKQSDEQGKK